jgi:hypothetical protein
MGTILGKLYSIIFLWLIPLTSRRKRLGKPATARILPDEEVEATRDNGYEEDFESNDEVWRSTLY